MPVISASYAASCARLPPAEPSFFTEANTCVGVVSQLPSAVHIVVGGLGGGGVLINTGG